MINPQGYLFIIDDLFLQKKNAIKKVENLISFIDKENNTSITRKASTGSNNDLIVLFTKMLECLNLKTGENTDNINHLIEKLSLMNKTANKVNIDSSISTNSSNRQDEIKIASKSIKDSHYQIDISKDSISKNGNKIFMVSCYARDAYLGRYLIKRNFYFTNDREDAANLAYNEILTKMTSLKDRYYSDIIDVPCVSAQIKTILDGVISEIKSEEDNISTTVKR